MTNKVIINRFRSSRSNIKAIALTLKTPKTRSPIMTTHLLIKNFKLSKIILEISQILQKAQIIINHLLIIEAKLVHYHFMKIKLLAYNNNPKFKMKETIYKIPDKDKNSLSFITNLLILMSLKANILDNKKDLHQIDKIFRN